ncbi:MAG: transcription-repair coupling factor [Treponema sp. CETP13]|nr:MAG: transcription-repair coupling factor [Treponema sp. CETP13]
MNTLHNIIHTWNDMQSVILSLAPHEENFPAEIEGLQGALDGYFLSEYLNTATGDIVLIVPNEQEADSLELNIRTAISSIPTSDKVQIWRLPWWGMIPYRPVTKGSLIFGERASALAKLAIKEKAPRIFIITQRASLIPVPKPSYIKNLLFSVKKGQEIDSIKLAERLTEQGYTRVPRVTVHGEFTLRGEVLDFFMPGEEFPHRIVFDFDTVEQIKTFDFENQKSLEKLKQIVIYPMKEIIWTDTLVQKLENTLKTTAVSEQNQQGAAEKCEHLLTELSVNHESEGEELFYSMLFDKKYSIFDYLDNSDTVIFFDFDRLKNSQESFNRECLGMYRKTIQETWVPAPQYQMLSFEQLSEQHNKRILIRTIHGSDIVEKERLHLETDSARSFFGNISLLKETLENVSNQGWKVYIFAGSENQALRITELLKDYVPAKNIIPLEISAGFGIPEIKLLVIQENEIFGRRKRPPKSIKHAKSKVIDTFVELNPGDYVVHINYGIGKFKGIKRVKAMGNERDYINLEYADEETVFIPVEQVNLVQRYIGNEGSAPRLDKLGSKSWENRKTKVKKAVEDIAEKLIDLYSKRRAARGFPFPKDNEMITAFDAAFPYTETEDQLTVAAEIKADMEKPIPMDRLVCGDVGYGKTEMAMRAAFKAVAGGKQVAFLAPTTILAEQHYESCLERFKDFPVKIAQLSRFVSKAEQKKILERVETNDIDILIGTHRIIQKDVKFKNLGLMIIDEEQRFGVKDKEKLKTMKTNIDCLAMSATPIPRTLHMSLLKIRDMSLLTTPPQNRQAIETVIDAWNEDRVAAAIRREVERGGQVFYLHNRVESLDETRLKLEKLVPEMMVDIAHGQMTANQLDDIFRRFKMGGFHVLVATTIIENGIDIPNVNTIIIDRADMYGISQLYQLRGRVGRSDRKARAFLLYPDSRSLSEIAMKRLQVISDFTELGSGFKIAMKDMEIRGAGNLLGKDQSGEVYSVGFDLYLQLLEAAVERLSDKNYEEQTEVLLELEYSGFIPDSYISNLQTKMEIYKKVASVNHESELEQLYSELEDRFGPIPGDVASLLAIAELRIVCRRLNIASLKEHKGVVRVEFAKVSDISVDKVIRLIKENGGKITLDTNAPNVLILKTDKLGNQDKAIYIKEKLEML